MQKSQKTNSTSKIKAACDQHTLESTALSGENLRYVKFSLFTRSIPVSPSLHDLCCEIFHSDLNLM